MVFKNHLIVAVAGFSIIGRLAYEQGFLGSLYDTGLAFGLVLIGASLPDVDYPDSTVGKRVKWLSWPIYVAFGHRGITHSAIALFLFAWGYYATGMDVIAWLGIGWALHLVGDFVTDSGIPLMWPSKKRHHFILVASTSGISETVMVALVIAAAVAVNILI